MGKTNLFLLFGVVIAVVIAAELLVNDYTDGPEVQKKINSEVQEGAIEASVLSDMTGETTIINFDEADLAPKSTGELQDNVESGSVTIDTHNETELKSMIGFSLIEQVGFNNIVIQRVPFNGIMFERVDMRDFKSVPIIRQNLLMNNREKVAEFYEAHADSQLLANEIYLLIKEKAAQPIEAGINETNEFVNGSFYINYADMPDTAFLVVKVRESVYAFVYKKELHTYIKSLILLL